MVPRLLLLPLFAATVLSADLLELQYPNEVPSEDAEEALKDRAVQVIKSCYYFGDSLSPESHKLGWNMELTPITTGQSLLFDRTRPSFQVCSPRGAGAAAWMEYQKILNFALPAEPKTAKNDKHLRKAQNAKRMKIVSVIHPLTRLAKAYVDHFKDGKGPHFDLIRKTYDTKQLSFKNFVHYIVRGATDFAKHEEMLRDKEFNKNWALYYTDCPICHPDSFPTFVLKLDDEVQLTKEFEALQEVFDLEEFDFPVAKVEIISDTLLKALYSQLAKEELDELVDFYQLDLSMYQYSPEKIYSIIVKNS